MLLAVFKLVSGIANTFASACRLRQALAQDGAPNQSTRDCDFEIQKTVKICVGDQAEMIKEWMEKVAYPLVELETLPPKVKEVQSLRLCDVWCKSSR